MPVPNTFANATTSIPLSQLDANFATAITLGNTSIQLGNTVTTLNNMTFANVTVSSGSVTVANVTVTGVGTFAAGSNTAPSITTSGDTNTGFFFPAADTVATTTGGTERMRVDSSGNVGIGTSAPGHKLEVFGSGMFKTGTNDFVHVFSDSGAMELCRAAGDAYIDLKSAASEDWDVRLQSVGTGGTFAILTNGFERARIDSSGNLLVGLSSQTYSSRLEVSHSGLDGITTIFDGTAGNNAMKFRNGNGQVGSIVTSGSATTYNTSSDYRLKHSIAPMNTGLATVSALKPVTYKWNADDSMGEGFIAHELQSVIPAAVTGEKDAVNEDGSIKPQGVDYSKIVVHLVAAIQELSAKVAALEAKP